MTTATETGCVIRVIGLISGSTTGFDGQYLVEFDAGRDGHEPSTGMPIHVGRIVQMVSTTGRSRHSPSR